MASILTGRPEKMADSDLTGNLGARRADGYLDHLVELLFDLILEIGRDLIDIAELDKGPIVNTSGHG